MKPVVFKKARHNPPHLFFAGAVYMLTGSIYQSEHLIHSDRRKVEWRDAFHYSAKIYDWLVVAWVVLHNHYHAIVRTPEDVETLSKFTASYHKYTARMWNDEDGSKGRQVWWNYWDTCVRSERDFNNRLRYVFWNPVKHELVEKPEDYPFSNYKQFMEENLGYDFSDVDEVNDVPEY